ncbi:HdeD family acid-resistance protein [Streptomyces sp. NPDC003697]
MTSPSASPGPVPSRGAEPQEGPLTGGMAALANAGWQLLFTMGVATTALGVIALVWPGPTLRVIGLLFGVYLLATGAFQLAAAFGVHVPGHLRVVHFLAGAATIVLGLICFRSTLESLFLLALWIGFSWVLRGTLETVAAASDQTMPARGWHVAFGIIGALAGIVMIVMPFVSIAVLTLVVGVMAIVLGLTELVRAVMTRIEISRLTAGTARERRPLFHARPHAQH